MHTDEAVHAIKFGALLEKNHYRYDPFEYHGPTLNYFSLIPAWFRSARSLTQVDETMLRSVTVFFGLYLIAALLLLQDGLSWRVILVAGMFTAISPAMVFFSRYYIQEPLLVAFTFTAIASGFKYSRNRHPGWALAIGFSLGMMHATKETCVIVIAALVLALLLGRTTLKILRLRDLLIVAVAAISISALFTSSFTSHPRGVIDSYLTYLNYFHRAGHHTWHLHPPWTYLKWLAYNKTPGCPLWSEALVLMLAIIGIAAALRKNGVADSDRALVRFIALYSVILTVFYSIIPYKTPWILLGFHHGLIIMAGIGAVALLRSLSRPLQGIFLALLGIGCAHLAWQSWKGETQYYADPSNPYVYAHPVAGFSDIVDRIEEVAAAHPDGRDIYLEVIFPNDDYWPFPWYLRAFTRVGYWSQVDFNLPRAPLIIASPKVEDDVLIKLYDLPPPGQRDLYLPLFDPATEFRPGVEIRGYVVKKLWDRVLMRRSL